jgi:ectoine hydroxylase
MNLSQQQVERYHEDGFLLIEEALDQAEVTRLCQALDRDCRAPGPHLITEDGREDVRVVYASHRRQPEFAGLIRDLRLLGPARQLLDDKLYIYQFKINVKSAFGGERYSWHQDYLAWRLADNLQAPLQINVAVFLDDVDEFNGPVIFLPGSHHSGLVHDSRKAQSRSSQHVDPDDISLTPGQLRALVAERGMTSPKGPAGSVVFFSPEIIHGSAPNMSPFPRRLLITTYNQSANLPSWKGEPRPEYVVCRDSDPLNQLESRFLEVLEVVGT